jgi:hypothetical protein
LFFKSNQVFSNSNRSLLHRNLSSS